MWAADRIEKLVPYLRRYARASIGDTHSGDASVERVLKQILVRALDNELEEDQVTREAVFTLLEQDLEQIVPGRATKARRALLLLVVEGFPDHIVRRILGVDAEDLAKLIELAEQSFAASTATSMLIIEDEPLISAQLKRLSERLGHQVIGVASTAERAVELQAERAPDIVLCDIHLADGSLGTDAISAMKLPDSIPVVFITAYPENYLSSLNQGPSYLITKPFDPEYVKAVIGHALLNVQDGRRPA
ncbi:MAG: response regulator [Pseudomonadota bacterium]